MAVCVPGRSLARRIAIAAGAGGILLVVIAPMSAQAAEQGVWTYRGAQECTYNSATTDRSQSNPEAAFGKSQVQAWQSTSQGACREPKREGPGRLVAKADLYKWNSLWHQWQLCRTSGWVVNTATATRLDATIPGGASTMPCGDGWYGTMGSGLAYSDSSHSWNGGTVYSGAYYFASGVAASTASPDVAPVES